MLRLKSWMTNESGIERMAVALDPITLQGNSSVRAIGVATKPLVDAGDGRGSLLRDRPEC